MTQAYLKELTLASAAQLIRSKEISVVELTRAILDRIDSLNDRMGIFITVTADHAISQAKKAQLAIDNGAPLGPLHGVPISLKDLFDTKGIRTTAGSRVFENRIPDRDATVTARLNAAGAVLVGKTNMHEFAFGPTSINSHYGTPKNPWHDAHIPGGSSGGSATSVALSVAFGSLGSDTGGSIRIPAALTGIVGLKPTYGRVSIAGTIPLSWSLDHIGPLTRTVEDAALMMEVIAGHDPRDAYSSRAPISKYSETLKGGIRGFRVGIPRKTFYTRLDPEIEQATQTALSRLEQMGAEFLDIEIPTAEFQRAIFTNIASPEAFSYHEPHLLSNPDLYGSDIRARIESGRLMLSSDFVRAQRARSILKAELGRAMESVDILITPTVPIPAPKIEQKTIQWDDGTEVLVSALTRNTRLFNLTGLPAITIPCGFTSHNLPIGLQIIGKPFDEASILRAAYAYEQDTGWWKHQPTM